MSSPRPVSFAPLLLLLGACDGKNVDSSSVDDTATPVDDTGDDSGQPDYAEGCILVDGAGGYASLQDAITVASAGAVITLCAGTLEEAVLVDKPVTIEGPGADLLLVNAPVNQAAFTITASDVSLSGFAIQSTRSGVLVEGASGVTLSGLSMTAVENYGIKATDTRDLRIEDSLFEGIVYGAVLVEGGSATLSGDTFNDNTSFAVKGTDGAALTFTGNSVNRTLPTDERDVTDGHGLWLVDAEGVLSGNSFIDNTFVSIYADSSDLESEGDTVQGSLYGVAAVLGKVEIRDITTVDAYFHGVLAVTTEAIDISGAQISGDPAAVVDVDSDSWSVDTYVGVGLYTVAPVIRVSDSTVTGYNNAGMLVVPYDTDCEASLQRVTLKDNGRIGLYAVSADLELEDVSITGVVEVEDAGDEQCFSVGVNAAVSLIQSAASWTGGAVEDNDGYGIASLYSVLVMDGASVAGNSCAGIMSFGGSLTATGNQFSRSQVSSFAGSVVSYEGLDTTLIGNSFSDSQTWGLTSYSSYDDGAGSVYEYYYYGYIGSDVQLWYGGDNTISDNTFVDGTEGLTIYLSDATVEDNTWSNYEGNVLYLAGSEGETVKMKDNTVEGFKGYGAYCSTATLDIDNVHFSEGGQHSYSMEAFLNGAPYYSYESIYSTPVLYGYNCSMTAEDVEVRETDAHVLRAYGGSYELSSMSIEDVARKDYSSYDTLYFYAYLDTSVWLTDVSIKDVNFGGGVGAYLAADVSLDLVARGLSIAGTSEYGVAMEHSSTYTSANVSLEDSTISDTAQHGVYSTGGTLSITDSLIKDTGSSAIYLANTTFSGDGTTATDAGGWGLWARGGTVALSDSDLSNNGYSGIYLSSLTGSVTGNIASGNQEYGMECSSVTFSACANDLSGNALGELDGCDAGCAVP